MGTIKTYKAGGDIPANRFVKLGSDDKTVVLATAQTDSVIGVSDSLDSKAGDTVDVCVCGLTDVEFAATVASGDVSFDEDGKAVSASTEGHTKIVARTIKAGAADAIVPVVLK